MALEPFIAEIMIFAGNFAPKGWATCDGQILSIAQNTALFSLLGTTYGGDGRVTFGLPDLRGRVPMHAGNGPGLTPRTLGEKSGSETITLLTQNLPPHQHTIAATGSMPCHSGAGSSDNPVGAVPAGSATDENYALPAAANGVMAPVSFAGNSGLTGSGVPVPLLQPYLVLNFCIALQGIFPSRN